MKLFRSNRYISYRQFKTRCETERYLYDTDKKVFRDAYIRFRWGLSDLYIHKLRYNTEPYSTLCPLCRERDEDEFHFVLQCPALYDLRDRYLTAYLIMNNQDDPMVFLMASRETSIVRSLSMYLYKALRRRTEAVESVECNMFYLE